jgi:TonB family protein
MARSILAVVTLLTLAVAVTAQDNQPAKKYDVKRCTPKIAKRSPLSKLNIGAQEGEKATGYSPLISFQVLESGEVANARVKRSSGFAHVDRYALDWIKGMKYNARSGCGVTEIETSVSIQWTGGE